MSKWQEKVPLAPYTTINLGGPAKYFITVTSVEQLKLELQEVTAKNLRVHILAGGSNTIFSDDGFSGLIIKIDLKGIEWLDDGEYVLVTAQAGEPWEPLAAEAVKRNLAGFECLAGIPGSVGGTPVQNVGAYGQDVSQTIVKVRALDRKTLEVVELSNADCHFSYRMSWFKGEGSDRYVIISVTYRLPKNGLPKLVYQQVIDTVGEQPTLAAVQEAVLALRRSKSMVVDLADPHTRSCGSFFMNPILSHAQLDTLVSWAKDHAAGDVPHFWHTVTTVTVPAAWFVEQAGFRKGLRREGVGISDNHPLALVNYGGTTVDLLALAADIQIAVRKQFALELVREPVIV
jgi:UDP-N-acetylmuramate dehydrogenase